MLKANMALVLMDVKPISPFSQAPANSKRHVRRRFAVGMGDRIVQVFADFLKTDRINALLSDGFGDDLYLALMQVHGFETVVPRVLLVGMQIER